MSKETGRKVYGAGERGEVVVITVEDNVVDGSVQHAKHYVVRMGAFTMSTTEHEAAADVIAKGLVNAAQEGYVPESSEPEHPGVESVGAAAEAGRGNRSR